MAERLGRALQKLVRRFESVWHLTISRFKSGFFFEMKHLFLILALCFLTVSTYAQQWHIVPEAGFLFSKMPVKHSYKSEVKNGCTTGFKLGLDFKYYFSKNWDINSGLFWHRTGKKETTTNAMVDFNQIVVGTYKHQEWFRISNLHLPLMINYNFYSSKFFFNIGVGFYVNMAISGKIIHQVDELFFFNDNYDKILTRDKKIIFDKKQANYNMERIDVGGKFQVAAQSKSFPIYLKAEFSKGMTNLAPKYARALNEKMTTSSVGLSIGYFPFQH